MLTTGLLKASPLAKKINRFGVAYNNNIASKKELVSPNYFRIMKISIFIKIYYSFTK
jgi:hypothetical protein